MRRRFHSYLVVVVALLGAGGVASILLATGGAAAAGGDHRASAQASGAGFTKTLVGYLRQRGFRVSQGLPSRVSKGYPSLSSVQGCKTNTYPALNNCFANNPAAPYVGLVVKPWPNEYVDPVAQKAYVVQPGYSATYRLAPRDAIVFYGRMPPPGRYFGLQTWEFSQQGRWNAKDYNKWAHTPNLAVPVQYLFDTIPPNDRKSRRVISFSSLGDIVNNVVVQRRSGYPFGKNRYFIITPSATTDHAVRLALHARGVRDRDIFTEQIPSRDRYGPIGPLGMGKDAIDFITNLRYAVPDPGFAKAADRWRSQLPLTVLRVRAPASLGPVRHYGLLRYERHTAHSEAYLAGDLQKLVAAVCGRASSTLHLVSTDCTQPPPASSLMTDPVGDYGWSGPYCRKIAMDCLGDQRDALFYVASPRPLDSGQVYALVSTLATQTDNATYTALAVNDPSIMAGVTAILDTSLKGSANMYASSVHNTGKFYVHYFARDCSALKDLAGEAQNCTPITYAMVPKQGDTKAVGDPALHGMFQVAVRDYIAPGTERAPDASRLLTPRFLAFKP